ncbi:MAG: tRNA (adenosine(37)-N6)-dimethylallyltransferase MiaA [Dehalococcoidia bacterium]|nr:tRNA (adenosine(37)-N6)-dimethylallyltransferase MiaA [Dehalococcoidia bacterium]
MQRLIVVVGPTAIGKSDLALHLAERFGGEIVDADSRQAYRFMDIGTAKPTIAERARVTHHLVDVVAPGEEFTLATYQNLAYAAIGEIHGRGRLPLLVGGSGLYVRAVVDGMLIPRVPPSPLLRAELEARASQDGAQALYEELAVVDPIAAAKIDARNVRRVIRALEVYRLSGTPISELQTCQAPPYRILIIGLTAPRDVLYRRIDERVDKLIEMGLVQETRDLVGRGYSRALPAMSSLGYGQICMFLRGEIGLDQAIQLVKNDTHRFARQQYNWFRPGDPRIHWLDITRDFLEPASSLVCGFISKGVV